MPEPIFHPGPHYGEAVAIPPNLVGPVDSGRTVRVNVSGRMTSLQGNHTTNARLVESWLANLFAGGHFQELRPPLVGSQLDTRDDGYETRSVNITVDGQLRASWPTNGLHGEILRLCEADLDFNDFSFSPNRGDVWVADLNAPARVVTNLGGSYEQPPTSAFVEETARETYGAVSENVGAFAKGTVGGLFGGFFSGAGWLAWVLLVLVVLAAVLFVVYLAKGGAAGIAAGAVS